MRIIQYIVTKRLILDGKRGLVQLLHCATISDWPLTRPRAWLEYVNEAEPS